MNPALTEQLYVGGELELFDRADQWKQYWISRLRPWIGRSVLEVGAGLGANTVRLRTGEERRWACLEPDPRLVDTLRSRVSEHAACRDCEIYPTTTGGLELAATFDTVLYIDVLEHIEDDGGELRRAAELLGPGGHLIVLSPAHQWLFSEFDRSIGHYRRYTTGMLRALTPDSLRLARAFYLDSVGLLASAANRFLLRQALPNARQLGFWDRCMVPCSRWLDPLTGFQLGKSVVAIWERTSS